MKEHPHKGPLKLHVSPQPSPMETVCPGESVILPLQVVTTHGEPLWPESVAAASWAPSSPFESDVDASLPPLDDDEPHAASTAASSREEEVEEKPRMALTVPCERRARNLAWSEGEGNARGPETGLTASRRQVILETCGGACAKVLGLG